MLGGGYSARLNAEIRIKRGLSYGASARLTPARTTGSFRASAQTKNESAVGVLGLIDAELGKLAAEPASAEELKARKSTLVGDYGRDLATSGGLADILGNLALYGVPLEEVGRYTAKVGRHPRRGAGLQPGADLLPPASSSPATLRRSPRPEGEAPEPGGDPERRARPGQPDAAEGQ